ncbi:hypothetical protein Tco_0806256 [Tanacetum coccineum]
MVVGFGYSANMLTEYLHEVGENTSLTDATSSDVVDVETLFVRFSNGIIQMTNKHQALHRNSQRDVKESRSICTHMDDMISEVTYEIKKGLIFLGATIVEDKLQQTVKTIIQLRLCIAMLCSPKSAQVNLRGHKGINFILVIFELLTSTLKDRYT